MVLFGTGKYIEETDIEDTSGQALYAIHDRDVFDLTIANLQARALNSGVADTQRTVTGDPIPATEFGWYAPLSYSGERVVYNSFAVSSLWVVNTLIPDTQECGSGTTGWTILIDWTTGLAPDVPAYDANNNGSIDSGDLGYAGFKNSSSSSQISRAGNNLLTSSNGDVSSVGFAPPGTIIGRRLSWDEKFPFGVLK